MAFTAGTFDILAEVHPSAIDVVIDVILEQLRAQGKTTFTQQIGSGAGAVRGSVDVELTDLSVPGVRSLDLADRFRPGNTLASFRVDAELKVVVTVFGLTNTLTETFFITLVDLQFGIFTTPGGLPVGVSLGFQQIDIDAGGLQTLRVLNPALDVLADFIALGVRTLLSPLGLVPIPVLQFADAFVQLGLSFEPPSPHLGTNQGGDALAIAADFKAAGNSSDIAVVTDIIPANSPFNVATVLADRPINQLLPFLLTSNQLPRSIPTAGADFSVRSTNVSFLDPASRASRIQVDAHASARIKVKKGGFFGKLFGKKKVTVHAYARITLDAEVVDDPATGLAVVDFAFEATLQARASIQSVLVGTLTVLLAPFIVPLFIILSQVINFAADKLLPLKFDFSVSGSDLEVRLTKLQTQLQLVSTGFTEATVKIRLDAQGDGRFALEHFTRHQIQQTGVPLKVGYEPTSLESRRGELFLGVELAKR